MAADLATYPSAWSHDLGPKQNLSTVSPILEDPFDFSGDSTYSPNSPMSPAFDADSSFPGYSIWLDPSVKNAGAFPKQESFDAVDMSLFPSRDVSSSPVVDPADLMGFNSAQFTKPGQAEIPNLSQAPGYFEQPDQSQSSAELKRGSQDLSASSNLQCISLKDACSQRASRKRKSSASSSRSSVSPPPAMAPKRVTHNLIEKRYRTNLNDKIAALRNAVPSLRVMVQRLKHQEGDGEGMGVEDLGGLAPANKLNKATILSKATEYIAHLEKQNLTLAHENDQLRNRVAALEMAVLNRGNGLGPAWG